MNEKIDIRKLQLEILNREDKPVRTYHIMFDVSEGLKYRLKIGEHIYSITADGEIYEKDNQPFINKDFIPDSSKVITLDPLMIREDGKIRTETDKDRQKQEIEKNKFLVQQNGMINKTCKYYPCHKNLQSCVFCYCPFYACGNTKRGKYINDAEGKLIWDCSKCEYIHKKSVVDKIFKEAQIILEEIEKEEREK